MLEIMWHPKSVDPIAAELSGFSDDAKRAITSNPDYFVWWYTTKSLALCAALAALAYYVGKDQGRKLRAAAPSARLF
jgi:hypothetical protein